MKEFLGSLVLSQERHHTVRVQWATKAPWSLILAPFASSVHRGAHGVMLFIPPLVWAKPHDDPADNLKGTRFSNPFLWWKEAKRTKRANISGFTQHMQSLPGASALSAAPQWSGVECPVEFSVVMGLFRHLPCPAPWHLATWHYWALETWWVWLKNWMLYFMQV